LEKKEYWDGMPYRDDRKRRFSLKKLLEARGLWAVPWEEAKNG